MMAQEMYEKAVQLEEEVDACRHLIQRWIPHMTSQMHNVDKMREEFEDLINGLPSSVVEDDDEDYEPEFKCDDCCHPDGTPRKGIGCGCGRNDDDYDGGEWG